MAVGMVSPLRHRDCRINQSVLRPLIGALLLGVFSAPHVCADANYELAVSAKQSEIRWKQADPLAAQPAIAVDGNGRLTVLFVRRKATTQPGISYAVEFTSNVAAGSWTENTSATEQVTSIDENWERVLVTDSSPVTASRFARVRVRRP